MEDCPIIKTTGGLVKGKISKATDPNSKLVFNYLGIPYGKAPIGKQRFLASEKAEPWEGTLEAVHTYKLCPQVVSVAFAYDELIPFKNSLNHDDNSSDEDCLKLNVFTPQHEKNTKLPVMVWLNGGHYQRNFGGRRNGTPLAGLNDAVVVIPNFRVNAFGFLSFGKGSCCPGNAALHDVILALKWVQENIASFGGDESNVTLFGESSGSGMVQLLTMSPLSKDLFHKAIVMSGTVTSPFLFNEKPEYSRDVFLKTLGLDMSAMDENEILDKLQNMPVEKIMEGQKNFSSFLFFAPTIDGVVIPDSPSNLLKSGQVHRIPLMIGCTNSEGTGMLPMRETPGYNEGLKEEVAKKIFIDTFQKIYKSEKGEEAFNMAHNLYMKDFDPEDPMHYSRLHGEIFSDSVFVVPTVVAANAHAAMGLPTFLYQMTQQPEFNHSDVNGPQIKNRPDFVKCDHADDLHFVWGVPFEEGDLNGGAYFTEDEIELSRQVMKYFVNFATSGNPNEPRKMPVKWPAYAFQDGRNHMVLQIPLETDSNLAMEKVVFYTQTLPTLAKK